jgi:glycosyltransferase involved in cell wall biosynthesis
VHAPDRRALFVVEKRVWLDGSRILSSLRTSFGEVRTWVLADDSGGDVKFATKRRLVVSEGRNVARLAATRSFYRGKWLFVCLSGHYSCLAFAWLLGLLRREPRVYLANFYLHGLGARHLVRRVLRLLLGPHVRILCQSIEDARYFAGIRQDVVLDVFPYCQGPLMDPEWLGTGDYVFAGGHTNRDYDLLLKCARRFPSHRFVIACSKANAISDLVPENVEIVRDSDWSRFHFLLGHSRFVVVPLQARVGASGQMVVLAAMEAGKPVIVPDVGSVAQYVRDGTTGLIYELGDEDSLADRLAWCLEKGADLVAMGDAGRREYQAQYVRDRFDEAVVANALAHARS